MKKQSTPNTNSASTDETVDLPGDVNLPAPTPSAPTENPHDSSPPTPTLTMEQSENTESPAVTEAIGSVDAQPCDLIESNDSTDLLSLDSWRIRINSDATSIVQSVQGSGRTLIKAKMSLGHGNFLSLFKDGKLRVVLHTAQLLMKIARNEALSNTNNYAYLPPALNSLSALASLDQRKLQRAIDAGKVTPSMTIADAKDLVKKSDGKKHDKSTNATTASAVESRTPESDFDLDNALKRLIQFVDEQYRLCPDALVDQLLRRLISHIELLSSTL